jgi:cytochrome c oxidase assembly protein subunit 11
MKEWIPMEQNSSSKESKICNKKAFMSNKRLMILLTCAVFFMFGFSYLMVPIFTFVCKQVGINGKNVLSSAKVDPNMQIDSSRSIKIEFATTLHSNMQFIFRPEEHYIKIHPGERKTVYFYAENRTGNPITIQAVPSITPADGALYFKKIECFCFTQQSFARNEKAKMFVNFYIDPKLPQKVKEITLAYTLFDATAYRLENPVTSKGRINLP